ncbi:hypothetical protein K7472_22765 [Streptomyces sp. PTM05]|uniref:DUF4232 domain-containing protein n=1 Tax=Streptantibioticus parmotrematis TaxID=2873249 RepID=A0ABS7R0S5_9ACTN|nr:hypothetical protein [Streptantibioticus parmotrematis]MBY8887639.1 hypothetical protein [Streptantibioticus parmotrematis]
MNGRLLSLGAAALVAGAVLTGCGTKTVSTGTGSAPMSPGPSHSASSAPSGGTGKTVKQAIAAPVAVSGQDRKLTVTTSVGGCKHAQLLSQETAGKVTLTLEVVNTQKPGQMCPDFVKDAPVSTTLKAPLDHRQVVDATTGKTVTTHG